MAADQGVHSQSVTADQGVHSQSVAADQGVHSQSRQSQWQPISDSMVSLRQQIIVGIVSRTSARTLSQSLSVSEGIVSDSRSVRT